MILEILLELFFIDVVPFGDLLDHVQDFLCDLLVDYFKRFWLNKSLSVDVQWQVVAVNDSHNEWQVLWNQVRILLSDQNSSHIEFQIIFPPMVIGIKILWYSIRDVQDRIEHNLPIGVEMYPVHRWVRLFAKRLEEVNIILFINVILVSQPQRLLSVYLLPFVNCSFDFLCLFVFGLFYLQVLTFLRSSIDGFFNFYLLLVV